MLKDVIEATRLSPEFCAGLLRVTVSEFRDWMDGKRQIPQFVMPEFAAVLGIHEKNLVAKPPLRNADRGALAPAVWFRLRAAELSDADREFVGLVRHLGFFMDQLDSIRQVRSSSAWRAVAQTVLGGIDRGAPPAIQGRDAASAFRAAVGFEQGQTGIGEVLRPRLRHKGIVIIESPIPKSSLEGCAFAIGSDSNSRPCVFGNTFKSTWFRRNDTILHEVCHAVFDLENDAVSLDFREGSNDALGISEVRARAFAQECLAPRSVLVHYANQLGIDWAALTVRNVAQLIASIHVEQQSLLRAAYDADLISDEQRARYAGYDCAAVLRELSYHSWPAHQFLRNEADLSPKWIAKNRNTTLGTRTLRLPAGYVKQVIDTLNLGEISFAKAAELLMMDRYTFSDRFGDLVAEPVQA
jgi:Zn-dependent peptidase ImmA (M78 family)